MSGEYQALVEKVDGFVAQVAARRRDALHCQRGCDACCHVELSVGPVEAEQVRAGLRALPAEVRARVRARSLARSAEDTSAPVAGRADAPAEGRAHAPRCVLLEDDGSCAIYAHRPLVCRSQGHALRYPPGFIPEQALRLRTKGGDVTWCPLNFTEQGPRNEDVLDAERVDQILAVVTRRHVATQEAALARSALSDLAAEAP